METNNITHNSVNSQDRGEDSSKRKKKVYSKPWKVKQASIVSMTGCQTSEREEDESPDGE